MSDVVVFGAGGMGREAHAWLLDAAADGAGLRVVGYLDELQVLWGSEVGGTPVLGALDWLDTHTADVVLAVGDTAARRRLATAVVARGRRLVGVRHPTAVVGPRVAVGAGTLLCPNVIVTTDVSVGKGSILNFGCVVGHDANVGNFVNIGPNAALAGQVTVADGADVGMGASVIQGCSVGADTVVGAGAVVTRSLPAGITAVGVPAAAIAPRHAVGAPTS